MSTSVTAFILLFYAAFSMLLVTSHRQIIEAIKSFRDDLPNGGGPRSPMHPSPVNDRDLITRRKQKCDEAEH